MANTMRRLVAEKHLRRAAVEEITGLSRSTIYSMMSKGQFPRPVKLTGKAVGWVRNRAFVKASAQNSQRKPVTVLEVGEWATE